MISWERSAEMRRAISLLAAKCGMFAKLLGTGNSVVCGVCPPFIGWMVAYRPEIRSGDLDRSMRWRFRVVASLTVFPTSDIVELFFALWTAQSALSVVLGTSGCSE